MFVVDRVVKKLYRYMKRKLGPSKSWSLELADGTEVTVSLSGVEVGQSDPSDDLVGASVLLTPGEVERLKDEGSIVLELDD